MKTVFKKVAVAAALMLTPCLAQAAYNSGSTGADGAFSPTATTAIQIPESGVFNYTTVNIPTGVTITFIKNSRNTPVTILATGDVAVAGILKVDGSNALNQFGGDSGPGGFAGGNGGGPTKSGLRGEGPGGGGGGAAYTGTGGGGCGGGGGFGVDGSIGGTSYSTAPGGTKGLLYGNEQILPLIGGSGGGGGGGTSAASGGGGGGGGGAILIASSGTINVTGTISAKGGNGVVGEGSPIYGGTGGGGSGGSIRLIAESLAGNGTISAYAGSGPSGYYNGSSNASGGNGSLGRIRLEYNSKTRTAVTYPTYTYGASASAVPTTTPTLAVLSIGGADVPATSQGLMSAPDVNLPWGTVNPLNIVVKGTNIPVGTSITIKSSPSVGTAVTATGTLAGTDADSSVTIPISIATAYPSVITATCTYTVIASNGAPIYAGGERVEKVRVASVVGGASSFTYITESGREIPVTM